MSGLFVLIHERSDETSNLDTIHLIGCVTLFALRHKGYVYISDTVIVVAKKPAPTH